MPARLIPIPKNWPPINDEEVLINPNKKNLKDKDEDSYPQKNKLEKLNRLKIYMGDSNRKIISI